MPSDKHNSITTKTMGLIFSLFDIASSQDVPFGIPQYVQYTHHGLTVDLLCAQFLFADSPVSIHGNTMHGFPMFVNGSRPYFLW